MNSIILEKNAILFSILVHFTFFKQYCNKPSFFYVSFLFNNSTNWRFWLKTVAGLIDIINPHNINTVPLTQSYLSNSLQNRSFVIIVILSVFFFIWLKLCEGLSPDQSKGPICNVEKWNIHENLWSLSKNNKKFWNKDISMANGKCFGNLSLY